MRSSAAVTLALLGAGAFLAAVAAGPAVAEEEETPVLHPVGHRGPDGTWPPVAAPVENHDLPPLTDAGRLAFKVLVDADRFTDTAVGYAGVTPVEVEALRILHRESNAAGAFLALCDHGTPAGRVWGMCGLWYHDPVAFEREHKELSKEHHDTKIETMEGCIVEEKSIGAILGPYSGLLAIVLKDRSQTCKEWFEMMRHPKGAIHDVHGGGWPCRLRGGDR